MIARLVATLAALILSAAAMPAAAYDEAPSPAFDTCKQWLDWHNSNITNVTNNGAAEEDYFVYGFVAGANEVLFASGRPAVSTDRQRVVRWISTYCEQANPLETVERAVGLYIGSQLH